MSKIYNNPFTDGVTLNPNAWYMRLLHWAWGSNPSEYKNLCPLFWSVIGTICSQPFILVFKFIDIMSHSTIMKKIGTVISIIGQWFVFMYLYLVMLLISICGLSAIIMCEFHIDWEVIYIFFGVVLGAAITCPIFLYFIAMRNRDKYNTLSETKTIVKLPYLGVKGVCKPFALFGYFISAIYHKCCPFIHWESEKK